jgi:hypothetical protein
MLCYDTGLRLVGDLNTIDFNFTQQKCSRYAGIKVSEKELSGEFADLSALAIDMSDWLNIKVKNEKNIFHLYLSNKLIYKQEYKKPLGKLIGIVVYFSGTGKLDDIKLYDSNQSLFYTYDFTCFTPTSSSATPYFRPTSAWFACLLRL